MPEHDELATAAIAAHDRQRMLPPEVERALVDGLGARLANQGLCLDAGIGTGSVALPLAASGIPVIGVDRSPAMLAALRAKGGPAATIPLVLADLARLPFRDRTFGAAIAAHVFHLIADWPTAVAELVRVVRPGGLLLVNLGSGSPPAGPAVEVEARFRLALGDARQSEANAAGPRDAAEFDACLRNHGAARGVPVEVQFRQQYTLEAVIDRLEHNVFAHPGSVDPDALHRAATTTGA